MVEIRKNEIFKGQVEIALALSSALYYVSFFLIGSFLALLVPFL